MYHVLKHLSSLKLSVLLEVVQTFSEELQEWKMKGGRKFLIFDVLT
jgi:hypothetical protein